MNDTAMAANACDACKKYKRKCDKALPSCSTCLCLRRACNYSTPDPTRRKPEEETALLKARVEGLEKLLDRLVTGNKTSSTASVASPVGEINSPIGTSVFSKSFFLDEIFFTRLHYSVQPVLVPVPNDIAEALNAEYDQPRGVGQLVSRYFDAVHSWMPIISKMRMKRVLHRPGDNTQGDTAFLLACMKLLLHTPKSDTIPEGLPLYRIVKAFNLQLEIAGLQSLTVIQGAILIAVYELGHGIYPAAYTTVAQCARQAISLGIHKREAPLLLAQWADWEERIRVWWFVVMLDRYVTVGRELRPLCTEDPTKNTPLPADSMAWDQGAMVAPERLYVSSPAMAVASPYARLAQAFNLLGRVIRHCDDHGQDLNFMLDEMRTLHQATSALLELTENEGSDGSPVASAVCFSALMKLHKNHLCNSFRQDLESGTDNQLASRIRECTEGSYHTLQDISLRIVTFGQSLERHIVVSGIERLSPLALHCLYRAAFWLSYLVTATGENRFITGRLICNRVLETINLRWKAAGTYLQILKSAENEFNGDVI